MSTLEEGDSKSGLRNLREHLWIIFITARRDWKVFMRYSIFLPVQILGVIVWPIAMVFTGRALTGGNPSIFQGYTGTTDFITFVILGDIVWYYVNQSRNIGGYIKQQMWLGTLEEIWLAPVSRSVVILSSCAFGIMLSTSWVFATTVSAQLMFGLHINWGNFLGALGVALLLIASLYGLGFVLVGLILLFRDPQGPVQIAYQIMMIVCGVHIAVQVLPPFLQPLKYLFPLTYGLDAIRGLLMGTHTIMLLRYELLVLGGFTVILPFLGMKVFNIFEKKARTAGTLAMY